MFIQLFTQQINSRGLLCVGHCWAVGRQRKQKRRGPYSKGALFIEETVTQRITKFKKC